MKKIFCLIFLVIVGIALSGCIEKQNDNSKYLRIHIRANDNSSISQDIKYIIKDRLVSYLTPIIAENETKEKAFCAVNNEIKNIQEICDTMLFENGFNYKSSVRLGNEFFPLRSYNGFVLESGNYDALIIELGTGKGDNWWCMVYPPLCFMGGEYVGNGEITYKSRILEIIEEFKRKYLN